MSRIPRWRMGSGIYHVLNRGLNNSRILSAEDERRNCYREFLARRDDESVELFGGRGNIVGDDNFKATVHLTNGRHVARNVRRPRKKTIVKLYNIDYQLIT